MVILLRTAAMRLIIGPCLLDAIRTMDTDAERTVDFKAARDGLKEVEGWILPLWSSCVETMPLVYEPLEETTP